MGIVYRARERHSGRLVALKMMLDENELDANNRHRFILEAQATGELSHPGIVTIHAWGEHERRSFYTMDYVLGSPLNRLLQGKPLPTTQTVRYLLGIARAVAAAHAQGIVHRDLKPGNIIIDPTDQPRILDFGLAKRRRSSGERERARAVEVRPIEDVLVVLPAEDASPATPDGKRDATPLTERGAVVGTPSYMAPEQARGQQDRVGPGADVHALGALLFEMFTGRPPFEAPTMLETLAKVLEVQPPSPRTSNPRVPATLAALCQRCLEKDPKDRYPDAGALADDLERRWHQTSQRRRFARLALLSGLAVLVLLSILVLVPDEPGLLGEGLNRLARWLTTLGEPMLQQPALLLALGLNVILYLVPALCFVAFLVWLWAWIRYSLSGSKERERAGSSQPKTEPYLQKLFGARSSDRLRPLGQKADAAVDLAEIELGKTLLDTPKCLLRRGRQNSLDRPVLVWVEPRPATSEEQAPGVVVHHPAVLSLHAVGVCPEGRYLVTGAAAATPLAELLERSRPEPLEAVALLIKVAYALQAFHDQGACHGRLGPEWILVHSDLQPLLCPCGIPSQAAADRQRDMEALKGLLNEWLPPRPRGWQRQSLATLYYVCDAARDGDYVRPADLAADLERAVQAAQVRRRERVAYGIVLVLFAVPVLILLLAWVSGWLAGPDQPGSQPLTRTGGWIADTLLMLLAPCTMLLGFVHARGLMHHLRLGWRWAIGRRFWKQSVLPSLVQVALITVLSGLAACLILNRHGYSFQLRVLLLGAGELLGFWLLGVCLAVLVRFGELLIDSLRTPADLL
jgi:serine/threonine protein kinase